MAIVSDVEIRLRADIARLQADMDAARRSVGGAMSSITTSVKVAGAALAAFAGAAIIGAIIALVKGLKGLVDGGIEAAGSLNDLSIQTGASVAALMQFREIGATSDTTVQSLTGAMNKLAKGMATANEESKGLPQAIKAIGLDFETLRKLAPEQQMLAVAQALDGFADGSGKSAVAMALYGKEGAKLLPFLKDLADEHDKVTAALTDQEVAAKKALAAMADNYGDNLTKIQRASLETRHAIGEGMLPALYEASQAFLNVTTEAGGFKDTIKKLSADGTLAEWTRNGITAITYLADAFQVTWRVIDSVFRLIAGSLTTVGTLFSGFAQAMVQFIHGDYQKSWDTMKSTAAAASDVVKGTVNDITAAMTAPTFGSKIRAQMELVKELKTEAAAAKAQVDFRPPPDAESTKAEEKRIKMYKDLLAVLNEHIAATAREVAGMTPYNAAQREMIKLDEEIKSGKLKLLPVEEALLRSRIGEWDANLASIESQKDLVKMREELSKIEKKATDEREHAIKTATDEAEKNEELARTFGMTKTQIEQLELARMKEQLAQRSNTAMTIDEITQLENLIALKERSVKAVASADLMKETKDFWDSIDKTAHDTFVSIASGGKDAASRLKDTFKNVFFDWLYQMTIKKWIINLSGDSSGLVSSLVSAFTGKTGAAGASSLPGASALASYMPTVAAAVASYFGAKAIAGDYKVEGIGNLLNFGGLIGGAINRLFGMGSKNVTGSTLNGNLAGNGFNGTVDSAWLQKGGFFRSDKSGVDKTAVDSAVASTLGAAYAAITSASAGYAKVLGLNADSIENRAQTISIALGKDEAANQKAIADFFLGVGDTIAQELLPNIAMFQQKGETAAATLQRVAVNLQGVEAIFAVMGTTTAKAFGATSAAAVEANERLVTLAGGMQSLAAQAQFFADNFLSAADRAAPAQEQVTKGLAAIGYGYIHSVDQYKQAVLDLAWSGALATESGAQTYEALLALAPAFKTVTDYTNDLKNAAAETASAALDVLGKAVDAQKNRVTEAYQQAMDVLEGRVSSLNDTISTTTALSKALRDALGGVDAPGSGQASRQVAVAQIQTALAIAKASGVLPSVDDLKDALTALKGDNSGQFGSLADYQRSVAQTNAALDALGGLSDTQLSAAEQQLAATIAQKDALTAANVAELARLDALVTSAQAQINAVNGVSATLVTVGQALLGVNNAAAVLGGYTGISATSTATMPTASDTIGGSQALLDQLQAMNDRLASMEAHAATTATSTDQFARQFNTVSAGGNALLTEPA